MLIRFEVENFRSMRELAELSMVAVDDERPITRAQTNLPASLVPAAGVFGPNASGKSNILAAMLWVSDAVRTSLRSWDEEIPVEPFLFGDAKDSDSSFVIEMTVSGIRFDYYLDIGRHSVSFEALYHYPAGRRRKLFEREGNELTLQRGLGELSGTRALLTDRTLALSIMRRFDEPHTSGFTHELLKMTPLGKQFEGTSRLPELERQSTLSLFDGAADQQMDLFDAFDDADLDTMFDGEEKLKVRGRAERRHNALTLLKMADLGISDVEIAKGPAIRAGRVSTGGARKNAQLVHEISGERVAFEFAAESAGTREWFNLIGPILVAIENGSVVLFDEIDSSLHPILTAQLVKFFQDPSSNPNNAQLIFTAHDTNLLNRLNRDEIRLTEKGPDGATRFGALADYAGESVRRSRNIEAGYLSGRFGALPDVSRPEVLRELGLIG
ncbi:AAA family ATPase [Brevibacterium zhoupengii]|uniref:AAA family ATPase n=1 Tax=Brevibacterium zhoupengii TaxID=2898795 RepID=UPI001E631965|nr:ATP-binding protein [Brevibacterium zhoupengii]